VRWWVPMVCAALYLLALAGVAELVERRPGLAAVARRPPVVGLALGVYATTWSFYGSVGFAATQGYGFLAIHLGVALSCLAIPVIWEPLAVLVRRQRLGSVADLLAYRYQSQLVGVLVSSFLVVALLPYLSLQLRAIVETGAAVAPAGSARGVGLIYAALLSVFAVILGVRWADVRRRGAGLLATLAVESLVKVSVLLLIGVVALLRVFGGLGGLDAWLTEHPDALVNMFAPAREDSWVALCFAAFVAAFLLPRQFHIAFVVAGEGPGGQRALRHASWTLPLLLLLLNLPLPILVWAGQASPAMSSGPDLWVIEIATQHGLGLVVFLGGVSAASAMVLVSSIALSGMVVNHVVLPLVGERWLLQRLASVRRAVIVVLVLAAFALNLVLAHSRSLVDLGLVSFAAVAQLLPGVLGALLWPRGTRNGFLVGLGLGVMVWLLITVLPILGASVESLTVAFVGEPSPSSAAAFGPALWSSLLVNSCAYGLVSLSERQRPAEAVVAEACARRESVDVGAPAVEVSVLRERLASVLGDPEAERELTRALDRLGLDPSERRALALRDLGRVIESSLAERVGPFAAGVLVGRVTDGPTTLAALAAELERARTGDRGSSWSRGSGEPALELIRRYLARVLAELPLGVCAVEANGSIVVWNVALARLSGLDAEQVVGDRLDRLPAPWGPLLDDLRQKPLEIQREHTLTGPGGFRTLRLRRTALDDGEAGAVLVVEDLTERRAMLAELGHRDRLTSIGRLAAGVAHEVLNPLTGILMVARNLLRELGRRPPEPDSELPERIAMIVSEGQRIERIVRALLLFARAESRQVHELVREPVPVEGLVHEAVGLARLARARGPGLRFEQDISPGLRLLADRQGLVQVLVNLLTNAIDASDEGAMIRVSARAEVETVVLEVADEGVGIPVELAPRVFEPFFTTKEPGQGTGLGLATSYRIVGEQGGTIAWSRRGAPERGTLFRVTLPRSGVSS